MTPADLLTRRNLLIATGALLLAPKGHAADCCYERCQTAV